MGKNPAFPFYANDFLVDTLRWSRGMKSLHIDLMAESWSNKRIEDEGGYPRGLTEDDKKLWLQIKHKWVLVSGVWVNSKLELTRGKRERFLTKQAQNGQKGGRPKAKPNPTITQTEPKQKPIEEEIEKENEIEYRLKGAFDEIYLGQQKMKWPHIDFDFQLKTFQEKVRGSPEHYQNHDTGGLRLALQKQLRDARPNNKRSTSRAVSRFSGTGYNEPL